MDGWHRDRPVSEGKNLGLCVTVKKILNCWLLQLLALLSHDQLPKTKGFLHKLFMVLLRGP